jgi:hypothetical protein
MFFINLMLKFKYPPGTIKVNGNFRLSFHAYILDSALYLNLFSKTLKGRPLYSGSQLRAVSGVRRVIDNVMRGGTVVSGHCSGVRFGPALTDIVL